MPILQHPAQCIGLLIFLPTETMGKIGWVSLNSVPNKLFKFNLNVFLRFKDYFFKVLDSGVVVNGLPLMLNKDGESRFLFYWQADPTKFKSFNEDLLILVERVD